MYAQYISERWNNGTSTIESRSGEVYSIQHYLIKFVSDVLQVDGFLRVPTSKTDFHDITEKLLKLALNIINLT